MLWLPLATLSAVLLYQTTNAALYYLIGCGVYFWAYSEGEVSVADPPYRDAVLTISQVICAVPWTLPKRSDRRVKPLDMG